MKPLGLVSVAGSVFWTSANEADTVTGRVTVVSASGF